MKIFQNIFNSNKPYLKIIFGFNVYFFLLIVNFISYSIYAVLSRYNILTIEILINLNFLIFFYLYKKNPDDKVNFNLEFTKQDIIYFLILFTFLIVLLFQEFNVPLMGDEIAPTRRAIRTSYFASLLILNIFDINYLKEIPLKYIIQILNIFQIFFIISIIYFLKKKRWLFLFLVLIINIILRLIIKDAVHHPPLNHIFSTVFTSFLGLNHIVVRLSYFIPFFLFLIFLFKLISTHVEKKISMLLIISIATFPFLIIASVVPDHSIWSSLIFTFLLFYVYLKDNIDYKLCVTIISIGILFRISIFSAFILIGLVFIGDIINKRFKISDKLKDLFLKDKIFVFFLIFIPLFLVSIFGTPAFEGINNSNSFILFFDALKSNIIFDSIIKQIPLWYYPFLFLIFFAKRKIEIIIFFILNLIIYFSIQPGLWGNAKYVLEYGLPFFILGYFIFAKMLIERKMIKTISLITLLIIFLNVYDIYKFPKSRVSADIILNDGYQKVMKSPDKETKYLLKIPYSYDDAFKYIKKINAEQNTLLLGTTYGFFPEILENYSYNDLISIIDLKNNFDEVLNQNYSLSKKISEVNKQDNLYEIVISYLGQMKKTVIFKSGITNDIKSGLTSQKQLNYFSNINKVINLEYILLADYGDRTKITETLISQGWSIVNKFVNPRYRSTLILFKKY